MPIMLDSWSLFGFVGLPGAKKLNPIFNTIFGKNKNHFPKLSLSDSR